MSTSTLTTTCMKNTHCVCGVRQHASNNHYYSRLPTSFPLPSPRRGSSYGITGLGWPLDTRCHLVFET
eukprot:scaffold125117_cov33-Tisochrysis_lutea.AAC.1